MNDLRSHGPTKEEQSTRIRNQVITNMKVVEIIQMWVVVDTYYLEIKEDLRKS